MAKESGISLYRCDRCGAEAYIKDGDTRGESWKQVGRITADGTRIERFYCTSCADGYKSLASRHDAEFSEFEIEMKGAN